MLLSSVSSARSLASVAASAALASQALPCAALGAASVAARGVHSQRTLKRMRGHPRVWPEATADDVPAVEPPVYPVQPVSPLPSGWAPPSGNVPPGLPFRVERTRTRNLPVYTDFKNGRTRVVTVVRRYTGDGRALAGEMARVLGGVPVDVLNGRLEVEGNHVATVRTWLAGLGF